MANARYKSSPGTASDGDLTDLLTDAQGRLVVANGGGTSSSPNISGLEYNSTPPTLSNGGTDAFQGDANANLKVTVATALDEDIDAITTYAKGATYTSCTADIAVSAVPCALFGYFVTASSSGVISLYDNASAASGTAVMALSKSVSAGDFVMLSTPILMNNGVYFDLVSGTATVLVFTRKLTSQ